MIRGCRLILAVGLVLTGCRDTRREPAQAYLQTHPPAGFATVGLPASLPFADRGAGESQAIVDVRYRLERPTVETFDASTLPRGRELGRRLADLRAWALSLPPEEPLRPEILEGVAAARAPFAVKRVVTPAGTEVDALVTLILRKNGPTWEVSGPAPDVSVPGRPDADPAVPFDNAPEVAGRFDRLEADLARLAESRRRFLAERERLRQRSAARLAAEIRTGRTFEAALPDHSLLRLVVSRGLDAGGPAVVVLTVRGAGESSARFTGGVFPEDRGETVWRATQVATLAAPGNGAAPAATDTARHPVLSLASRESGLVARIEAAGQAPLILPLRPTGTADLIPDPSATAPAP